MFPSSWRTRALLAATMFTSGASEAAVLVLVVQLAATISKGSHELDFTTGLLRLLPTLRVGPLIAVALAATVVRFGSQYLFVRTMAHHSAALVARLRSGLFRAYQEATWAAQSEQRAGTMVGVLLAHVGKVASAQMALANAAAAVVALTLLLVTAFIVSPVAALAILGAVIALFFLIRPVARRARRASEQLNAAIIRLANRVNEAVSLRLETRVANVREAVGGQVDREVAAASDGWFRTQFLSGVVAPLYQSVALALVVTALAIIYLTGSHEVAALGTVVVLLVRALSYGNTAQQSYHQLNDIAPAWEAVRTLREMFDDRRAGWNGDAIDAVHSLQFDHVTFAYTPGTPVLRDISFTVGDGETIGIVGPSGAGKSTLVQLLLRLREPVSGCVMADGVDVGTIGLDDWYDRTAFVPQECHLVNGTVGDNIRFYRDWLVDADIEHAARLAFVHDEIISWPAGYETEVGEGVADISGGQRQRIAIARALAGRPRLLILDEPTSALDPFSEARIRDALDAMSGTVMLFVVAHRLTTLRVCNRIMVLEHGELRAFASPEELRVSSGFFQDALRLADVSPSA